MLHSEFLSDRQGIRGGLSVRIVVDGDLRHGDLLRTRLEVKRKGSSFRIILTTFTFPLHTAAPSVLP